MSRTMSTQIINSEVVIAYSLCPRKAFLLHCTEDRGTPDDYVRILEKRASANRTAYLATLQRVATPTCSYKNVAIPSGAEVLTEVDLEADSVTAYCDALRIVRERGDPVAHEPTIVVGTYRVEKEQMLNLSVVGYVLQQLQGTPPATGVLVTLDGECHRANLRPMYKTVTSILAHQGLVQGSANATAASGPQQALPMLLVQECLHPASGGNR